MIYEHGTRGTKRRGREEQGGNENNEGEVKDLVVKLQKLTHDSHKVDGVRIVHVKFAPGVILKAKKLFQGIFKSNNNMLIIYLLIITRFHIVMKYFQEISLQVMLLLYITMLFSLFFIVIALIFSTTNALARF